MRNRILSFALLLLLFVHSLDALAMRPMDDGKARKVRKVMLVQYVKDSFTGVKLPALVTLMRDDSTVVDTVRCQGMERNFRARLNVDARPAHYIIKAECDGYATAYARYELRNIARNPFFKLPDIQLRKRADNDIYKEVGLDGVVVTGTKVKFAYRGDTLVYNASAFNLPDGSMLDALVRQLPGAELKSNGDIYVNGRKVDYLTLNGSDFFKGNNKIMLDNLPHYAVKELKVYDKSTEMSQLKGRDVEKKDYVMDVQLKREYNRGYMANAEAAGGTRDRYMARLFGLYYDDYTRFSVFGNVNNVNENRRPGNEGDWSPANSPEGQVVTKQVGATLATQNKAATLKEQFDATASWNDVDDLTRSSGEQFASAGNIFSRSASSSRQKELRLSASNKLTLSNEASFFFRSSTTLNYADGTNTSASRRATYAADPKAWGGVEAVLDSTFATRRNQAVDNAINRSRTMGLLKFRTTSVGERVDLGFKLPWGDMLGFKLNGSYTSNRPQQNFSLADNDYLREQSRDMRHVYADTHNHSYLYATSVEYAISLGCWNLELSQQYSQNSFSANRLNYRLERLGGAYGGYDESMLSHLPSTRDSLLLALDAHSSQTYRLLTRQYEGKASLSYSKNNTLLIVELPYRLVSERINYECASVDTVASRRKWIVEPNMYVSKWNDSFDFYGGYNMSVEQPDFASLMPYDNDVNPLARRLSNPNLKSTVTHSLSASLGLPLNDKNNKLRLGIDGSLTTNMIGTRTTYDSRTGTYTYMSDNVRSGNWNMNAYANYTGRIDRKGLFVLDNRLLFDYTKSTDFDIAHDNASSALSRVYTSDLQDKLKLTFQKDALRLSLVADGQWRHSTGNRDNFQTLDAYDYSYGLMLAYKLPLGLQLSTDIKQYSRRGYGDSSLNTDDLVWNASLSRSFCKQSLTLTVEGFDLLHQLSNTTYTVNAQGRTAVWRNSIPNYCMMHVAYRFAHTPKKK